MRRALVAIGAATALTVTAIAAAQPPSGTLHPPREPGESEVEWGSALFAANCAVCHGADGQGADPEDPIQGSGDIAGYGPDLRGVGARAADFYLRTGRMPLDEPDEQPERQRPQFGEAELRALIAWVASLGKGPGIPHPNPEGASLSRGFSSFAEHCAGCHQIVGEGGFVTGARVPVLDHASPTEIAEAVRIGPYVMPSFSRKAIGKRELDALIAYIDTTKHPDDSGGWGIGHIGPVPEGLVAWLVAGVVLVGVCVVIGRRPQA